MTRDMTCHLRGWQPQQWFYNTVFPLRQGSTVTELQSQLYLPPFWWLWSCHFVTLSTPSPVFETMQSIQVIYSIGSGSAGTSQHQSDATTTIIHPSARGEEQHQPETPCLVCTASITYTHIFLSNLLQEPIPRLFCLLSKKDCLQTALQWKLQWNDSEKKMTYRDYHCIHIHTQKRSGLINSGWNRDFQVPGFILLTAYMKNVWCLCLNKCQMSVHCVGQLLCHIREGWP